MTNKNINQLHRLLSDSHNANLNLLEVSDFDTPVHANSEWQIRDIIWHLTTWDREVVRSIDAFKVGNEYAIPSFDEDTYNENAFQNGRKIKKEEVIKEYKEARESFIKSVELLPIEKVSEEMLYPWGDERGDIYQLVEYMVEHDAEHRDEINAALES